MTKPLKLDDLARALMRESADDEAADMWCSPLPWYRAARAILTTIKESGWAIVPVEATEGMIEAGLGILEDPDITRTDGSIHVVEGDEIAVWQAMQSAAPAIVEK